jgi:hypothetical protein
MAVAELPDLFELLHDAPESFLTLRGTIRSWHDRAVQERAFERHRAEMEERRGGGRSYGVLLLGGQGPESPPTVEETVRLWLDRPDRVREEVEGEHPRTLVRNGRKMWSRMPKWGAVEHDLDDEGDVGWQHGMLLAPLALAPAFEFEVGVATTVGGRDGIRVRSLPRPADEPHLFGLGAAGADEYELVVDLERGILLRTEARLEGAPFAILEFTEVAFDESLAPELFVFTAEPGEAVRSQEELTAGWEHELTLEEAAGRASFPLFVPARVWPTARMHVNYMPTRTHPPMKEHVSIHYWDDETNRQFSLDQQAAEQEDAPRPELERIDLDGVEAWVWGPPPERRSLPTLVRLMRGGTQIELSSQDFDREELLELARTLVPARTEPPRFE